MDTTDKVLICIIIALTNITTGLISHEVGTRNVREQAVLKNYGEWKVKSDGTQVTFQWK